MTARSAEATRLKRDAMRGSTRPTGVCGTYHDAHTLGIHLKTARTTAAKHTTMPARAPS
jgi:hypothetical protein